MIKSSHDAKAPGSDNSAATARKRDKVRAFFGMSKSKPADKNTPASQPKDTVFPPKSAEPPSTTPPANSYPDAKDGPVVTSMSEKSNVPSTIITTTTTATRSRLDIFPTNVDKPVFRTELPKKLDRLEKTPQLVYCTSLLPKDGSLLPPSTELLHQETSLDETQRDWLKVMERDPIEQDHIRWLGTRMVEEFVKDANKDSVEISEIVLLGPVLQKEHYRRLLSCTIADFEKSGILDVDLLQGLVQLVQAASPGFLVSDDLVKILSILRVRLQGTHQQSTEHPYHLTLAVSRVLDVMAEHEVKDLDRVQEHEPLSGVLSGLKGSSEPYLMYQACYAYQALQYVPDEETALQALLRHSAGVAEGLVKISGVFKLDLGSLLEGLESLQEALESTIATVGSVYGGVCSLMESGRGVMESLKEGFGSGQKRPWYAALRAAYTLVQAGQLKDLNQLVFEAACRRDPLFQWGICQLLGEIAVDTVWTLATRQQAVDLLGELYMNDLEWGRDESVKTWMLTVIAHLGDTSEKAVSARARALLQDLKKDQDPTAQITYPLRVRLPIPAYSPILARVQDIPYVEYDLHRLQLQQLEESRQAVYIPPQAKPTLHAKDEDFFPLMEKVHEFLESERQVMLVLGDSGAGKSTFNRHLDHELWTHYKQGGPIPLFINLPAIFGPEQNLVAKQLQAHNFSDAQIQELKLHRQLILICDGYDESQLLDNLHKTNLLNQPGQWNTKMVISCRTQFLGPSFIDRFQPQPSDWYSSSTADLFQQAVITPFTKGQIEEYIDQFRNTSSTRALFGEQPVWSTNEYVEKLMAIPNLMDLVKNPFLLTLALKTLPTIVNVKGDLSNIRITRVSLYDKFVTQWLEINMRRLQNSSLTHDEQVTFNLLQDEGFTLSCIDYMKRLSAALFKEQNGNPAVQYSHMKEKRTWKAKFFSPDPEVRLLREASPMTRTGNLYRFVHRSVMEYFYSRMVYDPNAADSDDAILEYGLARVAFEPLCGGNSEQYILDQKQTSPLYWKCLVHEPSILQFLAERVEQEPKFKQELLDFIELSKSSENWSIAASNAITILVRARTSFNGAELNNIKIRGADLSYGQFDSVQLEGADLREVKLFSVWMRQANLRRARMEGVKFGEWPYLETPSDVLCCTYSPDGNAFAIGCSNGTIRIYDTASWRETRSWEAHSDTIQSIVYSPSGHQIASGSEDKTVRLWDAQTGIAGPVLADHTSCVRSVAYSPSGHQIASGSDDKTVRLWEAQTGVAGPVLTGHTGCVRSVAYSPSGHQIASASRDKTVRLWGAHTGFDYTVLTGHAHDVLSVAYSPTGHQIASSSIDRTVRLWDADTGVAGPVLTGHASGVSSVAYSLSGHQIASSSYDYTVRLWDAKTGLAGPVLTGHTDWVQSVVYSPIGNQIASGSDDKTVRLWEAQTDVAGPVVTGHTQDVSSVAYSPSGHQIASGSNDKTVRLWDAQTGGAGPTLTGHIKSVTSVAYSPSGHQIVSGSEDKTVRLWDAQTGVAGPVLTDHTHRVQSVTYSPSGHQIASCSEDKTVRLWDAQTGVAGPVLADHTEWVQSVVYSPSGHQIASGSNDKTVRLWDAQTGLAGLVLALHTNGVSSVAYSPNGHQIASGSYDNTVRLWEVQTGDAGPVLTGHTDWVQSVAYSPSGHQIASGSYDKTLRLWDVSSGECLVVVGDFQGTVCSINWNVTPEGVFFVTGCSSGSICTWNVIDDEGTSVVRLCWSTRQSLAFSSASIQNTIGLSMANTKLLRQGGAVGEPEPPMLH